MQTFLGACVEIAPRDISNANCGDAKIVLLEGYVWDTPEGPEAMHKAVSIAKQAGHEVALSLSDSFCVERHHAAFHALASGDADIILGNEAEMTALFGTQDFDQSQTMAKANGRVFVMTRSERGSVIVQGDRVVEQSADPVATVVDSTGAGDAYVAGFLYAYANDETLAAAAALGTRCAALAIQQVGARPKPVDLAQLVS